MIHIQKKFGGSNVSKGCVLHAVPGNDRATIVGDLTNLSQVNLDTFN